MTVPRPVRSPLVRGAVQPSDRGSMLIEFGVTVPILMALLFAAVQFGVVLYKSMVVDMAASEAVYQLAVCPPAQYGACQTEARDHATDMLRLGGLNSYTINMPSSYVHPPGSQWVRIDGVGHEFLIPFLPGISRFTFVELGSTAWMLVEEQP